MNKTTVGIGKKGEDIAVNYLENKGYTILERNYRFQKAEIDIIAFADYQIVVVEVKMRSSTYFGQPEQAINKKKKEMLYMATEAWIHERKMDGSPVRFDIIAIVDQGSNEYKIKHFERVFM